MLWNQLRALERDTAFASIYATLTEPSHFFFGRILLCGETHFILESYAPDGEPDGWLLKEAASVFRIELNSQYIRGMQRLMAAARPSLALDQDHPVLSLLLQAQAHSYMVTVELLDNGEGITGWVAQADEACCKLQQVDAYGQPDGISYIDLLDITQISCHGLDEQRLERLAQCT